VATALVGVLEDDSGDTPQQRSSSNLRPVWARLALPPARSTICFAAAKHESPLALGREDRLPIPPEPLSWPYVFELELA
jgi:hypothetical protein